MWMFSAEQRGNSTPLEPYPLPVTVEFTQKKKTIEFGADFIQIIAHMLI